MPQRVLIVDDREDLREFLADAVASMGADLKISCAANGAEALEVLEAHGSDLIITDLDMPVMNGVELVRRLRARAPVPPIVIISGASIDWIAGAAAQELADLPMLRKPLSLSELFETVRVLLGL